MRTRRLPRRFQPVLDVLPNRISPTDLSFMPPPTDDPELAVPPVVTIPEDFTPEDDAPMPENPPVATADSANSAELVGADNYAFWMCMGSV